VTESQRAPRSRRLLPWAAAGAALVVGAAVGGVIVAATSSSASGAPSGSTTTVSACAVTPVADRVLSSVVTIAASGRGESGTGSGEVIRSDGYILTNNHAARHLSRTLGLSLLASKAQRASPAATGSAHDAKQIGQRQRTEADRMPGIGITDGPQAATGMARGVPRQHSVHSSGDR
jgi:putative serine protease PepD